MICLRYAYGLLLGGIWAADGCNAYSNMICLLYGLLLGGIWAADGCNAYSNDT